MSKIKITEENALESQPIVNIINLLWAYGELEPKYIRFALEKNYPTLEQFDNDPQVRNNAVEMIEFFRLTQNDRNALDKYKEIEKKITKNPDYINTLHENVRRNYENRDIISKKLMEGHRLFELYKEVRFKKGSIKSRSHLNYYLKILTDELGWVEPLYKNRLGMTTKYRLNKADIILKMYKMNLLDRLKNSSEIEWFSPKLFYLPKKGEYIFPGYKNSIAIFGLNRKTMKRNWNIIEKAIENIAKSTKKISDITKETIVIAATKEYENKEPERKKTQFDEFFS